MDDTTLALGPHQGYLREEIGKYLSRNVVGVDPRDPEGVRLLQAVAEFLDRKTTVDENLSAPILNTLKTIQDRLDCIEKQGTTKTPFQGSYASAAAAGGRGVGKAGIAPNATMKEEENSGGRRLRELVIRIEDETEREQSKTMLAEHILQRLQSYKHAETSQLVAARRLQSGDILLQAATVESRERLERNTGWEKLLSGSAKILRQTFPVLMHGVRVEAIPEGMEHQATQRIMRENEKYHPGIEISRVSWPKWAKGKKTDGTPKQYSSLLVELTSPETANEVVEKGMVEGYQLKTCSRYNRAETLLQCFNCYQYGHISSRCSNPAKCGTCAGNHNTREHQGSAPEVPKCAACGKIGHTAWHPECKVRQKEKERAQMKLASMTSRFPVRPRLEQNRSSLASTPIILDADGFQAVTRKRKALGNLTDTSVNSVAGKSKTGRLEKPLTSSKHAEKGVGQQTIRFSTAPTTNFTGTSKTPEQAFEAVLEAVGEADNTSMDVTSSISL